jgi:hypothetical protein
MEAAEAPQMPTEEDARLAEKRRKHCEKMKRYYSSHPEQRQRKSERVCQRYHCDEAYREAVKARAKAQRLSKGQHTS